MIDKNLKLRRKNKYNKGLSMGNPLKKLKQKEIYNEKNTLQFATALKILTTEVILKFILVRIEIITTHLFQPQNKIGKILLDHVQGLRLSLKDQ